MTKFSTEQAVAFAAVQELINEWAHDLDIHNGLHIGPLLTPDCVYASGETHLQGREAVEKSYRDRLARLSAQPSGVPTHRHLQSNLCVDFKSEDTVSITFTLLYFTTALGHNLPDAIALADVRMECRKENDGHWRISRFDSHQPFRRPPP